MKLHEALDEFDRRHGLGKYSFQKKLVDLDITETSLVDHPAHQHEGWAVIKSSDTTPAPKAEPSPQDFAQMLAEANQESRYGNGWNGILSMAEVNFLMGKKP